MGKFQKAKTFTSDLRSSPTLDNSEFENRKRRSGIVQAPSSKRTCSEDLRNFRISKPSSEERDGSQELVEEPRVGRYNGEQQGEEDENEEAGAPVDLSRSSPTFQSRPSSRTLQSSEHPSDQEVPVVALEFKGSRPSKKLVLHRFPRRRNFFVSRLRCAAF